MYCCEELYNNRMKFDFLHSFVAFNFIWYCLQIYYIFSFYVVLFPSPVGKFRNNKIKNPDCVIKALLVTLVTSHLYKYLLTYLCTTMHCY